MPTFEVTAPDGKVYDVTAPAGASQAQVLAYAKSQFGKQSRAPDNSAARGLALGAVKPVDNIRSAVAAIPGIGEGLDAVRAMVGRQPTADSVAANDAARQANTAKGAQLAGNVAGTLPTLALPGGPLVQGAVGGALLSDAKDARGVIVDTAAGALFSKAGHALIGGARKLVAPKVAPAVRQIQDALGNALTPGQAGRASGTRLGQIAGKIEDKMMSLPGVGDLIEGDRMKGIEAFNRNLLSRPLAKIGEAFPSAAPIGFEGVKAVGDVLSAGYRKTLGAAGGQIDAAFNKALGAVKNRSNLPAEQAAALDDIITRELAPLTRGQYNGTAVGKVLDRLDKLASGFRADAQNVYQRDLGKQVENLRGSVLSLVRRQNPQIAADLAKLNAGWAELVRIERAAVNSSDGVLTPKQYATAVRQADRSVRKRAVARGEALGQDISVAAQNVLPSQVPNSGTVDRLGVNSLMMLTGLGAAPIYAGARAVTPFATRQAGPTATRVGNALLPVQRAAGAAVPALLARRND